LISGSSPAAADLDGTETHDPPGPILDALAAGGSQLTNFDPLRSRAGQQREVSRQ
jgi:hypothetical protein